jgi:hypothetical protein
VDRTSNRNNGNLHLWSFSYCRYFFMIILMGLGYLQTILEVVAIIIGIVCMIKYLKR